MGDHMKNTFSVMIMVSLLVFELGFKKRDAMYSVFKAHVRSKLTWLFVVVLSMLPSSPMIKAFIKT